MTDAALVQVRKLRTPDELRAHLDELGVDLGFHERVEPAPHGPLARPVQVGGRRVGNRFCILPMEGWDARADGGPSDLVERRWRRFGASGAKLVWGEATAVRSDGRANPNQLSIEPHLVREFRSLREALVAEHEAEHGTAADLLVGLQLTHSGRWSRPHGEPTPRVAYRHPLLDRRVPVDDSSVFSDEELDQLAARYVVAAEWAADAGFGFVDIKHCHGYLLHELLSASGRPGRYGGDLSRRTRFLANVVEGIRRLTPDLEVAVRVSAYDFVPHRAGPGGAGEPEVSGDYAFAFGGDGTGTGMMLSEVHQFLDICEDLGVAMVCVTAGSPYYVPHIQRPAFFPPSDGYLPPNDPLVDVARMHNATAALKRAHPGLVFVGSGYSYLQEWLPNVAQRDVATERVDLVGLGRMALSYPRLPADVLAGLPLDRRHLCRTFSDCTTAPRNGLVSGCYPLDEFYKARPERRKVSAVKREAERGRRGRARERAL